MRSLVEQKKVIINRLEEQKRINQMELDAMVKLLREEITGENLKYLDASFINSVENFINIAQAHHRNSTSDKDKWEIISYIKSTHSLLTNYCEENLAAYINIANKAREFPAQAKVGIVMIGIGLTMLFSPIIAVSILGIASCPPVFVPSLLIGIVVGVLLTVSGSQTAYSSIKQQKSDATSIPHAMHQLGKNTDKHTYNKASSTVNSWVSFFGGNNKMVENNELPKPLNNSFI